MESLWGHNLFITNFYFIRRWSPWIQGWSPFARKPISTTHWSAATNRKSLQKYLEKMDYFVTNHLINCSYYKSSHASMDFDLIYKQHYKNIFNFCFRILGNEESARDMTQETFIRLFELKEKGHVPQHILAWLYKVSGNLCMNHLNRWKRGREKLVRMGVGNTGNNDPETIFIKSESEDRIRSIIAKLKPKQKMLILGYQDGLSYKELSLVTGIAVNSVGKTLWRTIDLISKRLNEFENG